MLWNELFNKEHEPSDKQIEDFVDTTLWGDLADYLQRTYKIEPKSFYSGCSMDGGSWKGWNVKYKIIGKALCSLYPKQGYFVALIAIGLKEIPEAEMLISLCSEYTQNLYNNSVVGHMGKSLAFEVKGDDILHDVKYFIALRIGTTKSNRE